MLNVCLRLLLPTSYHHIMWSLNNPNLNTVDYRIRRVIQERVYQKSVMVVNKLKQQLIETRSRIQQSVIDQAIDQWRDRFNVCVCVRACIYACVSRLKANTLNV